MSIEINHSDGEEIDKLMKSKGYQLVQQIPKNDPQDNVYVRK